MLEGAGAVVGVVMGAGIVLWMAMKPSVVLDVLTALDPIDSGLAGAAADIFLAWPKTYDMDSVLIPALVELADPVSPARCRPLP